MFVRPRAAKLKSPTSTTPILSAAMSSSSFSSAALPGSISAHACLLGRSQSLRRAVAGQAHCPGKIAPRKDDISLDEFNGLAEKTSSANYAGRRLPIIRSGTGLTKGFSGAVCRISDLRHGGTGFIGSARRWRDLRCRRPQGASQSSRCSKHLRSARRGGSHRRWRATAADRPFWTEAIH